MLRRASNLELTDAGRLELGYAQDVLALGSKLEESLRNYPAGGRLLDFRVGVADAVPKTIAYRLIERGHRSTPVGIICSESEILRSGSTGPCEPAYSAIVASGMLNALRVSVRPLQVVKSRSYGQRSRVASNGLAAVLAAAGGHVLAISA